MQNGVEKMISIDGVTKSYSAKSPHAVDDFSLQINDGEILGLVGLNGAGKTTTIRMVSGITLPTSGKIMVDGHDVVRDKVRASQGVGWIPEFPNFEPNAKPVPLMKYFAGFYGLKGEKEEEEIRKRLASVGLSEHLDKKLRTYSQGMKKRFSMAESLIGDPQNVLFDETLNGLDPEGVQFVRNMIIDLKKQGRAVLLSSHILSEVENIADRVAVIHHGKLIKLLSKDELKTLGSETIHVVVDNPDGKLQPLLEEYGDVRVTGNTVILSELKITRSEYADISERLMSTGYRLREFHPTGESLEDYFFSLIGESQ